jgi:hypothetical protein
MTVQSRPDLVAEAKANKIEAKALKSTYKESTAWTWLWSLLFGPIYFWVHGFTAMGFAQLLIAISTFGIGMIAAPFLAYYCWDKRAAEKAENAVALSKLSR